MNIVLRLITTLFACVLVIGMTAVPSYVLAGTAVDQMIESAKTKADHEKLAIYYEDAANTLNAKAEEHKKMAIAYRAMTTTNKGGLAGFVAHCDRLVAKYEEMAADNQELAKLHHQFAAALEK